MTSKPLRIAMITNRYLPIVGGAEMQANHLSRQLVTRGHTVNVITRRIHADFPADDIINDIPVRRLSPMGLGHRANALMFFRIFFYLLFHARDYDVFHVHSLGPMGLATLIAGKLTDTPTVIKIPTHGDISRQQKQSLSTTTKLIRTIILPQWLWRRVLSLAGAMITLTDEIIEEATSEGLAKHVKKIPNGVDIEYFHPIDDTAQTTLRKTLSLNDNDFLILFTGRLVYRKRVDVLVDALAQIVQEHPNCQLLLAGSGDGQRDSAEADLRQQVIDNSLSDYVTFLGTIDNVVDYLQAVDCFAFPSEREGMPNAVLEAMACGLPIVASRIDSITEILQDDMAYLVDVEEFSDALQTVIEQPDEVERMGNAVLKHVRQTYAINVVAEQYETLYRELLSR